METLQTPEPGWYADPITEDRLRLWDGVAWTENTRPVGTTLAAPPSPNRDEPHAPTSPPGPTRPRRGLLAVLAAVVVAGALAYVIAGVTSDSPATPAGRTANNGAAGTLTGKSAATRNNCPGGPASALLVVRWFAFQFQGNGFWPLNDVRPSQSGTCSAETFTDPRSAGTNLVLAFQTPTAAGQAASRQASGHLTVVHGTYVVVLDPSLSAHEAQYASWLAAFGARPATAAHTTPING